MPVFRFQNPNQKDADAASKEENQVSVELSRVKKSAGSGHLADLVVGAALIAVGVVLRALVPGIGGITPNVVIGTYCLAVMLLAEGRRFGEGLAAALGVGLVAAVLCTLITKSEIIGINFLSEPVGAVVGFLVFFGLSSLTRRLKGGRFISVAVGLMLGVAVYLLFANGIFTIGPKNAAKPIMLPIPILLLVSLAVAVLAKFALDSASFIPIAVAGLGTLASGFTYITIFKVLGHKPAELYFGVLMPVVLYTAIVNMILAQLLFGLVKAVRGRKDGAEV